MHAEAHPDPELLVVIDGRFYIGSRNVTAAHARTKNVYLVTVYQFFLVVAGKVTAGLVLSPRFFVWEVMD